jgi:DNA polymerase-1
MPAQWLLVDGFNLAYRSFFAIPELTRADGFPTNALHGWVKTIWKLLDSEKPHACVVFFDLGGAQDRLAILPEYKAQRAEMPEALARQIGPIKELTRAFGWWGIEQEGVESDDLLASQARHLERQGADVAIVSADKDFAQVVSDRVTILLPPPTMNPKLGWRRLDPAGVKEKFGVPPERIAEYLALMGDASDNIPGVPGVGPKTAAKWLNAHGSLEGVLRQHKTLGTPRLCEAVAERAELLRRNLRLTTLNVSLPPLNLGPGEPDVARAVALLEEYDMRTTAEEARRRYGQRELF